MEQYCLYLRKSRADVEAEARGESETLSRHEHTLIDLAKRLNLNIISIYKEIISGETITARPIMQQLLQEVSEGKWSGVLVMEVERLARGETMDQGLVAQAFKYSSTKIITPIKSYDPNNEADEEYFEFNLFMSRREYKTINRRLQRGRIASVMEGKFCGNKTSYGYKRIKLEHEKGYILKIISEEAEIVKMIFSLFTEGERQSDGSIKQMNISQITKRINNLNIKPKYSDLWTSSTIRDILSNIVYIGKIRWARRKSVKKMVDGHIKISRPRADIADWIITEGRHEAIIDRKTFETAQQLLKQNSSRPNPKGVETKNPLAGLIICGICGRRMVRRPYNGKRQDTLLCYSSSCQNISSDLNLVEARLLKALEAWLINYKLNWSIIQTEFMEKTRDTTKTALKISETELKKLEMQKNNLYDLLEQGIYTKEVFNSRSKQLEEKINQIINEKEEIITIVNEDSANVKNIKSDNLYIENIIDLYNNIKNPAKKNMLLSAIIEKAVYIKTVTGRWHNSPDDFTLIIYPRI